MGITLRKTKLHGSTRLHLRGCTAFHSSTKLISMKEITGKKFPKYKLYHAGSTTVTQVWCNQVTGCWGSSPEAWGAEQLPPSPIGSALSMRAASTGQCETCHKFLCSSVLRQGFLMPGLGVFTDNPTLAALLPVTECPSGSLTLGARCHCAHSFCQPG